jgi:hypothetical protein
MKALAWLAFFGLAFVAYHEDDKIERLSNRIYDVEHRDIDPPVKPKQAKPSETHEELIERKHNETHEELIERKRSESERRRKEYCDSHPNLAVRIGCQ